MKYVFILSFFAISLAYSQESKAEAHLQKVLDGFQHYAEEQRKAWEVPGMAIGIVKDNEVLLAKGFGQKGLEDTDPVDENTLFQIGSLSKAFTSALIAIAQDQKLLNWNDKVSQHLPNFRLADPWVTTQFEIEDLLAQRSGLPPYAGDTQAFLGFSSSAIIQNLQYLQPASSFRSRFAYQNNFFLVAARILELKTGLSYEELLHKNIFSPLGMAQTSVSLKDYLQSPNRAEWLIRLKDGSTRHLKEDFPYREWNYILAPAGGINSTIKDMTQWILLQANQGRFRGNTLISQENMERMRRAMIYATQIEGKATYYALGWLHMDNSPYPIIWHDGATLGVYNAAAFIPEERLGIVVLTNVRDTKLAIALAFQFFDLYFKKDNPQWGEKLLAQEKHRSPTLQKPRPIYPPMALSTYTGIYHNPIYGAATVQEQGGNLVLLMGKNQQPIKLEHWNRDTFTLVWPYVENEEGTKVFFTPDERGSYTKMKIEMLADTGSGEFEKQNDSSQKN